MTLNFPTSPSVNDTYTYNGTTFVWDGEKWDASNPFLVNSSNIVDGAITASKLAADSVTAEKVDSSAVANNLVINGSMAVAQRSTTAVTNVTSGGGLTYDTVDRWGYWANSPGLFTSEQDTDAPDGFYHSTKITSLTNATMGAGGYVTWSQRFEAQNLSGTDIGTANAKALSLSFWVKASITGTYSFYLMNPDFNELYTTTYTVDATNTWEQKTISVAAPTGTFSATGNGRQLEIGFTLGAGTTYSTSTLNQWHAANFTIGATGAANLVATSGATLNVTGVQLTATDTALPFQHEDYGTTLQKCQRYFHSVPCQTLTSGLLSHQVVNASLNSGSETAWSATLGFSLPGMRTTPTVNLNEAGSFTLRSRNGGSSVVVSSVSCLNITSGLFQISTSSATDPSTKTQMRGPSTTSYLILDAEL